MRPTVPQRTKKHRHLPLWLPSPLAGRLLVAGHILILLSLGHFAYLLGGEGQGEALLYMEAYMGSVALAPIPLWAGVLALDWLERRSDGSR